MTARRPLDRARVVATARAAIEAGGVENLSLRAVARTLGVTAPALYAHVADKDDLVAAVAAEYFTELSTRFGAVDATDPIAGIRALSRAYVDHALAAPELFRLLFRFPPESAGVDVPGVEPFLPATDAMDMAIATTGRAIEAGLLAVTDPLEAAMTMWVAVHGVAEVLLMGFGFAPADADRLVDTVIDTVLAGQMNPMAEP